MTTLEQFDLSTVYLDIKDELEACDNESDFNAVATDLALQHGWDLMLVRAVGRGLLTTDRAESADFIRTYLGAVENDREEREKRAQWLADFLGVTRASIGATLAHRKISRNRPKTERRSFSPQKTLTETRQAFSEVDRGFIFTYVNAGGDKADKAARRQAMAEKFGLSVGSIPALMAHVTMKAKAACELVVSGFAVSEDEAPLVPVLPVISEDVPVVPVAAKPDTPDAIVTTAIADSSEGAHIEYDNHIKNRWRAEVAKTLAAAIPEYRRAKMKVLCLPGKEWVEVSQIYLALGFRPENIYGVEREASVREDFEANAARLGCQAYFGTLDAFFDTCDTPFDVVSLDFLGPLGGDKAAILSKLKLSKKAYVLVNYMAQREKGDLQRRYALSNDLAVRHQSLEQVLFKGDVAAAIASQGVEFSLAAERGEESQVWLRKILGRLDAVDRSKFHAAAKQILLKMAETGKIDEVVKFMRTKMAQERVAVGPGSDIGNGSLNRAFEERVADPNFKTEILEQPQFLVNYIRYVLDKNLSLPEDVVRELFNVVDTPGVTVSSGIIKSAFADVIASQIMPIWSSYISGTMQQVEVLGAWDYKARRNRFHSDLLVVEDSKNLKKWHNNATVKQLVGLGFKLMTEDLSDRKISCVFEPPKVVARVKGFVELPPVLTLIAGETRVSVSGKLIEKAIRQLAALEPAFAGRTEIV